MSLAALKASQNNYSTSYLLYEKALIINPGSSVIHEKLGLLNLKVNNYKEALNEFNLSYAESPANTAGMRENNFASNEIATKLSLNNSIIKTTTILNIHPDFRNAWLQLAYLQYRLNNIKASKKALLRALNLDPNYSPSLQLQTILR